MIAGHLARLGCEVTLLTSRAYAGPGLPEAPSPISQAVVAGTHCYVSGQLAVDTDGVFRPGTAAEEARHPPGDGPGTLSTPGGVTRRYDS